MLDSDRLAEDTAHLRGRGLVGVGIATAAISADDGATVFGSPPAVAVAGRRAHPDGASLSPTDYWHIGSVSKSFTALLLALLQEQGSLRLSDTLRDLLPDMPMHASWSPVTLLDLLQHRSGLPANFPLRALRERPQNDAQTQQVLMPLLHDALAQPRGRSRFLYSNLGYVLAGEIARRFGGASWRDQVRSRIARPLGLTSLGYGPPEAGTSPYTAPLGHRVFLGWRWPRDPVRGVADNPRFLDAAGRIHLSLEDLLRYGAEHLRGGRGVSRLAGAEAWRQLHAPQGDYACGWMATNFHGARLLWHNGTNRLWYTLLVLVPQQQRVFVFVTNQGSYLRGERWFFRLLREYLAQ